MSNLDDESGYGDNTGGGSDESNLWHTSDNSDFSKRPAPREPSALERARGRGVLDRLAAIEREFEALAPELDDMPESGLFEAVERLELLGRKVGAARGRVMERTKDSGLWAAAGARSFNSWMSTRLGGDKSEVGRTVREAAALRDHLPHTSEALAQGAISGGHVSVMVKNTTGTEQLREVLKHPEIGEEFLVEQARIQPVDKFRQIVKVWAQHADPDAADSRWQEHAGQEYLTIAKTMDGYHLQGWLSELSGKTVVEAINAAVGVTPEGDTRTLYERNAQGLTDIANAILSSGPLLPNATVRPHLSVTVEYDTLKNLLSETRQAHICAGGCCGEIIRDGETDFRLERLPSLDDGTILTGCQLAFLACDSSLTRIVFGPKSEVLDVGRAKRTVTPQQRKAVEARDRVCQFPGCGVYSHKSEVHHVIHWASGGETSVENSILLCRFHHQHVHMRDIKIKRRGHKWAFRSPDGELLNDRPQHNRLAPGFGEPEGGDGREDGREDGSEDRRKESPEAPPDAAA